MKNSKNESPQEKHNETPDYYWDEAGRFIFTETYHLSRGYCCGEGCLHCPYDFEKVPEPRRSLLKKGASNSKHSNKINYNGP